MLVDHGYHHERIYSAMQRATIVMSQQHPLGGLFTENDASNRYGHNNYYHCGTCVVNAVLAIVWPPIWDYIVAVMATNN